MNKEIYKVIPRTGGRYSVSNKGNVRDNSKGRILKPFEYYNGYLGVTIVVNGQRRKKRIHRLVAETFIPHVGTDLQINHKDENKKNNTVSNLEWCTPQYNANYGTRTARTAKALSKPVDCYDMNGNYIQSYASITEASYDMCSTIHGSSNISKVCKGQRNSYKGYKWRYSI